MMQYRFVYLKVSLDIFNLLSKTKNPTCWDSTGAGWWHDDGHSMQGAIYINEQQHCYRPICKVLIQILSIFIDTKIVMV